MVSRVNGRLDAEEPDQETEGQDRRGPTMATGYRDAESARGQQQYGDQGRGRFGVGMAGPAVCVRRRDAESGDQQHRDERQASAARHRQRYVER